MHHLTQRVAWHDNRWNGTICRAPSENPFCVALDRIREERDDVQEDALSGSSWRELAPDQMPPCIFEASGFMNKQEWRRTFVHPYQSSPKAATTHGYLKPTVFKVPEYSFFAVPFAWMLNETQANIEESLPEPLPPDEPAPFNTPWVFGRERQEALVNLMFGNLTPKRSLVFLYTKEGHPLGDSIPRLVVGIGRILHVGKVLRYDSDNETTYPLWDRVIEHSIRPEGEDGFLLPYHDYLEPTGDPEEDSRRRDLLSEITVPADLAYIRQFSYVSELASPDVALSTLVSCLEAVRRIREHGIAEGPWELREEWLNARIAEAWEDRGAFPGLGSALEALGLRLGTALSLELLASGTLGLKDDPWPVVDKILRGEQQPPKPAYKADLEAARRTWIRLSGERRDLIKLLSRFSLTPEQANRWFDPGKRGKSTRFWVEDADIMDNPHRIAEADLGTSEESPISVGVVDRGLLPESTIAARHPVPEPSAVASPNDRRRVRACMVAVLQGAAERGDALMSVTETLEKMDGLRLERPPEVGPDWITGNDDFLEGTIDCIDVLVDPKGDKHTAALQLTEYRTREERLAKILRARAEKPLLSLRVEWRDFLIQAIGETGTEFKETNERHVEALQEQVHALERITTRKLSALVGRAGTGKTSVLGALLKAEPLAKDGVLLLAPTGKARVRLSKATNDAEAMTIAQFLYRRDRYDGPRQRPLFTGGEPYRGEKTVVIDECSMLTMDDLMAVLAALDQAHVQRIILVGDPNQLPPIGVGRPFADFAAFLEQAHQSEEAEEGEAGGALARLTVEVRASAGRPSDTLRLASWFTREQQPIDADRVFSDLELGGEFNDLEIAFWQTPEELRARLLELFQRHLDLADGGDVDGFNRALGFNDYGHVPFERPEGVERFQILSPVRMHPHGVHEINRWVQRRFRGKELRAVSQRRGIGLGDEDIVVRDKVIQVRNERRKAFDRADRTEERVAIANGEIGAVAPGKYGWLNVVFAGRSNLTFGYRGRNFPHGSGPLELAYALTVHKAQGSDFRKVFVVLPKDSRLISRELLYTALTRSRDQLVLLLEGKDASFLYEFTKPEESETARRNTNLFKGVVRERELEIPYADHLIHRTEKGHMVRSKSELVIANMLYRMGIDYQYERPLEGEVERGKVRPDFSFADPAGDLILWEHLGMLGRADYREGWAWKKAWYEKNGFVLGRNLFTTEDDERGGLDSTAVRKTAENIAELV